MTKYVLLISPLISGFYQDIIDEMIRQGYGVDFIPDELTKEDPDFVRGSRFNKGEVYKNKVLDQYNQYWTNLLSKEEYSKKYDILFVIDGRMLSSKLFEILRFRNPKLYAINYLFDTTRSVYRFNINFKHFNKVVTFDRQDAKEYDIDLLPIPWSPIANVGKNNYILFAMGAYIDSRYDLYRFVSRISSYQGWSSYIKLFTHKIDFYPVKYILGFLIGKKKYLSPLRYYSNIMTNSFISKEEFTSMISGSEVIVDSIDHRQDGLTARCTWALGSGKKIITDNKSIIQYGFYTPEQIFVVENFSPTTARRIIDFVITPYEMPNEIRHKIDQFRIDIWIKNILNLG